VAEGAAAGLRVHDAGIERVALGVGGRDRGRVGDGARADVAERVAEPFVERLEEVEVDAAAGLVGRREAADDPGRAVAHGRASGWWRRARVCVCVSAAPRGKSAAQPQCPSPRAPGGRQHEQADAGGARREAVP